MRAEDALAKLTDDDFAPVFMRSATAYGVSHRLRFDIVLNNLAWWAYTTRRDLILSDPPWRPLVHVRILADAVLRMLTAPVETVRSQAFNIGAHSQNYRVRDLAPRWTEAEKARVLFSAFRKVGLTTSANYTRLARLKLLGARVARFAGNGRLGVARRTMPICTPAHGGRDFEPWLRPSGEAA